MNEWNTFLWRTTKCLYYVWTNVFQNIVARFLRIWIVKQNESKIKDLSRSYSHCNKLCNIFIEKQTLILYWLFDVDCTWSIVHSPLSFSQTKFLRNFWFLLLFVDFSSKRNEAILVFIRRIGNLSFSNATMILRRIDSYGIKNTQTEISKNRFVIGMISSICFSLQISTTSFFLMFCFCSIRNPLVVWWLQS